MDIIQVPKDKLDWIGKENNLVDALTLEMERVLNWYRDHPQHPLDLEKMREKIIEAHTRLEGIRTLLTEIRQPAAARITEDSSTDVWL